MPALHHALLGASVVALAAAGIRIASLLTPSGLPRALAAAVFATAAAVAEAILLGLVGLGGSTAALTLAAIATGAAALALAPRPETAISDELATAWRDLTTGQRVVLGATAGAALAWTAWQLRHPALGFDAVHYHVPEMVLFVQGGHPGSIHDVLPGLPVGNYPLVTEVTVAWAMGIARSFVPVILWPWLTLTLTATAGFAGLRALGTTRLAAALAAAALCTNPWLLAWQSNGSVTDPPALAFLVTCAALTAMSRANPRLLAAALVAGGLAIGCKTTALPFTMLVLAVGVWLHRKRLPWRPLGIALAAATLVGGVWYLRNLFTHGSPFWPIVSTPWGDPVPASVKLIQTSFLDRPRATVDLLGHEYLSRFGGALLLGLTGLLAPLTTSRTRKRALLAAAAMLAGLLIWARSPITGIAPRTLPETIFSTTRYLLPVVAAACLTLALAATDAPRRLRALPLTALVAAVVINLVQTFRLDFPVAPSATTPLIGAVAGAATAVAIGALRMRRLRLPRAAAVAAAVVAGALLAIPASGFVKRQGETRSVLVHYAVDALSGSATYRDGDQPVASTPAYIGPLAGDELKHRLEAIPADETCAQAKQRLQSQWLVVYGGPLGGVAPAHVKSCLPKPFFDNGGFAIFAPTG